MTVLNIVTEDKINEKKIAKIEEERDMQLAMIDERFKLVDQKFQEIFKKSINQCINSFNNNKKFEEAREKAIEINKKFSAKKTAIRSAAQEKIDQIKAAEKAAMINELDNLVNEICG